MNFQRKKKTIGFLASIFFSGVILFSFQNCGNSGLDSDSETLYESSSKVDQALITKYGQATGALVAAVPFAFEAGLDQITYNSCAESGLSGNKSFFSLRLGAYQNMGIRLNSNFYDYVENNFRPNYGESELSQSQYESYLSDSPNNKGSIANISIRSLSDLAGIYAISSFGGNSGSSSASLGQDVIPLAGTLSEVEIMDGLLNQMGGQFAKYFPFSSESKVVEAKMSFNKDQSMAQAGRNLLSGDGILALTYLKDKAELNQIRAPAAVSPLKMAYGKGYRLTFTQPKNVNAISARVIPSNIIGAITEIDLTTGRPIAINWDCKRSYIVVRTQDQATLCPALTWEQLKDPLVLRELEIARRQLTADSWDINPKKGCVVPRGQVSCYNEEQKDGKPVGVNYWPSGDPSAAIGSPEKDGECFNPLASNYSTSTIPTKRCANYITICTRF